MNYFARVVDTLRSTPRNGLAQYIADLSNWDIYIYGAGCFGHELQRVLGRHDVAIKGFVDRHYADYKLETVSVYAPSGVKHKGEICLVIGIVMNKADRLELEGSLRNMGYCHIVDGQSIRAHYVYASDSLSEEQPVSYFQQHTERMAQAMELMADEESRCTYRQNLTAHILRDYSQCYQTEERVQYFPTNVPFHRGNKGPVFVDCGAYVGDTLESVCKEWGYVYRAMAFEPDINNFALLNEKVDDLLGKGLAEAVLFPCGVADKNKQVYFNQAGGSSSISEIGGTMVRCISLSEALKGMQPTYIKMDIEGAEYDALLGAQELIANSKPDLAISVYHIIDDFYRIPLLIHSWNLGYKFYLRTHSSCCMETILYAVTD